jgi:hypothetical protein
MAQTATTGNLANAQRIILTVSRYTEEHNAPAMALTEQMTLQKGAKTISVPKVAQMTISDLVDGQDLVDEEDIGMTTVDLTSAEVGAKIVLTDKLVRQMQESVFRLVGRQLGDGMARKKDTDVLALYTNLNSGTVLGATTKQLTSLNLTACIAFAKSKPFSSPIYWIHHPNAVAAFVKSAAITPSAASPVPRGWTEDILKDFYVGMRPLNGVPGFEDGNITEDSSGDGIGAIASKGAMVTLTSVKTRTERQRDASMRGTELVMTADYGVFELDNELGAGMKYVVSAPTTSN